MRGVDLTDLETAIGAALEAIAQAEKLAPSGVATQWCQLAKVQAVKALEIIKDKAK